MRTTWQSLSNKTKLLTFLLALTFLFLFSGCVTINHTTVPTFNDYQLCDFLTPNWITLSDERIAVISELKKRNLTCMGGVPTPKGGTIKTAESPPSSISQPPKSSGAIATGTGFLFSSQDYIVTNYHVVKGTSEVTVKFLNGESINAEVIARDTQNDVAILKLTKSPSFQSREMKFGDSSMVRMGDEVFTIGYPHIGIMGLKPKYTKGVISAVTGIKDNPTVFQTTVPIQPGNSGGPLFNEKGEVVGLTTSSLSLLAIESMGAIPQSVNYAVKSSFIKNVIGTIPEALLSNRGMVLVPTDSNSRADFIEAISKNVVLILGKVD